MYELPLHFIENEGQFDVDTLFYAYNENITIKLYADKVAILVDDKLNKYELIFRLSNICAAISIAGLSSADEKYNFKSYKDIAVYKSIKYKNIWNDIDLLVIGRDKTLYFTFIVGEYGSPNDIKFNFEGHDNIKSENRNINIIFKSSIITLLKPTICCESTKFNIKSLEADYVISDGSEFSIELLECIQNRKTIIVEIPMIYLNHV